MRQPRSDSNGWCALPWRAETALATRFQPLTHTADAWRFYALPLLLAITACTATPTPICPAIVEYTRAEQLQASKDLDLLPDTSPVHRFMGDYKQLRAKLRECT